MRTLEQTPVLWRERQPDTAYPTLEALRLATKRLAVRSVQVEAKMADLWASVPADVGDVRLSIRHSGFFAFSNWSFGQLCALTEAPREWFARLPLELLLSQLNYALGTAQRRQERLELQLSYVDGPQLRAMLDGPYYRLANDDVVRWLQQALGEDGLWHTPRAINQEGELLLSDRNMFLYFITEQNPVLLPGVRLLRGFEVRNSDVGQVRFDIRAFLYDELTGGRLSYERWRRAALLPLPLDVLLQAPDVLGGALAHYLEMPVEYAIEPLLRAQGMQLRVEKAAGWLHSRVGLSESRCSAIALRCKDAGWDVSNAWSLLRAGLLLHREAYPWADVRDRLDKGIGVAVDSLV